MIPVPKSDRPGEGQKLDPLQEFDVFVDVFGRSTSDDIPDASVACGPYSPRPKDCPGLGTLTPSNDRGCPGPVIGNLLINTFQF